MKQTPSKLLLIFSGAFLFTIIFWNEKPGLNTVLFDMFICSFAIILFPYGLKGRSAKWLLLAHFATTAMIVIQNTFLSEMSFIVTLLLFVSFSQYIHRSVLFAGGSALQNYLLAVPNFFRELRNIKKGRLNLSGSLRTIRILLIPFSILFVFFIIYSSANTVFSDIFSQVVTSIQNFVNHFFDLFPIKRFEFFLLGIFIVSGLLIRSRNSYFSDSDLKQQNELVRKKGNLKKWRESSWSDLLTTITGSRSNGILALKNEFKTGTISLILLNILLFFINIIDVKYVWLGYTYNKDASLSAYVHEGAGLLISSIILAMLVLLFFFRGNLNFYKKNKWLRYGAYLWILQNSFLVLSVLMRDYYYISHYGLAYRRIGLLFFLIMVFAGLVTVFFKICYNKTAYYLLRINAWVAVVLLVIASCFHWDEMIAEYNIARKASIPVDVPFLLSLSDSVLPLLQKNSDILGRDTSRQFYYNGEHFNYSATAFFEYRKKEFLIEQQHYSWLSWNATDAHIQKELTLPFMTFH